jgi:hypothetical protein
LSLSYVPLLRMPAYVGMRGMQRWSGLWKITPLLLPIFDNAPELTAC